MVHELIPTRLDGNRRPRYYPAMNSPLGCWVAPIAGKGKISYMRKLADARALAREWLKSGHAVHAIIEVTPHSMREFSVEGIGRGDDPMGEYGDAGCW